MARTIQEIKNEIIAEIQADVTLSGLTSTSAVAKWRLYAYIVASAIWAFEKLLDIHKADITTRLANQIVIRLPWFGNMTKAFQYGHSLVPGKDYYDNTGLTEEEIAASKVIPYAVAVEVPKGIRIKIAGLTDGELAPVASPYVAALTAYWERIRPARIKIFITNDNPDSLKMSLTIFYNALILDNMGKRIDGTNDTPVLDAINNYLKNDMPFNGAFIMLRLIDALQQVEGVVIPHVNIAQARYAANPYEDATVQYVPDAGYLRILNPIADLLITYIPREPI